MECPILWHPGIPKAQLVQVLDDPVDLAHLGLAGTRAGRSSGAAHLGSAGTSAGRPRFHGQVRLCVPPEDWEGLEGLTPLTAGGRGRSDMMGAAALVRQNCSCPTMACRLFRGHLITEQGLHLRARQELFWVG